MEQTAAPTTSLLQDFVAARRAVLTIFAINGAIVASWVTQIPYIQTKFALGEGVLGLVLLTIALGAVTSLLLVGGLIARFGSRVVTMVSTLVFCTLIPLILLAPNMPLLIALLVLFGVCNGAMDVSMNTQAIAVEEAYKRPIMSTFHALFSTGGLAGAAFGSLALWLGAAPQLYGFIVSALALLAAVIAVRFLLPSSIDKIDDAPVFVLPTGPLLLLGLLCFFGLVSEGAIGDWSAVYLRNTLGADASIAAVGFAAFSLTMAIGRFTGDALRERMNGVRLVQLCGLLSAAGLGLALLVAQPWVALFGFACVGLGLANIVPVLFSAAGRIPGVQPGAGIAAVSTTGYAGFLFGPPLIGFVAEITNLAVGLGVVVVCCVLIALLASATPVNSHARR